MSQGAKRSDVLLLTDTQTLSTAPWCTVDTKLGCIRFVHARDVSCVLRNTLGRLTLKPSSAFAAEVLLDDLYRLCSTHPPLPPRSLSHMFFDGGDSGNGIRSYDAVAALRDVTFKVQRSTGVIDGCAGLCVPAASLSCFCQWVGACSARLAAQQWNRGV